MKWHLTWVGWGALTLLLEAVGLKRGGPMTRTVRRFVVGSAAGTVGLLGFLGWLAVHFGLMARGFGWQDVAGVLGGGLIGLGFWAHRTGQEKTILKVWLFFSGAWKHMEPFVQQLKDHGMDVWRVAPGVLEVMEDSDLQGLDRMAEATRLVREQLGPDGEGAWTVLIHAVLQVRLLALRVEAGA